MRADRRGCIRAAAVSPKTRFGFWVIGVLLSAAWAVIFGLLAFIISNADQLWFYVVCGLAFIVMLLLHIKARDKA